MPPHCLGQAVGAIGAQLCRPVVLLKTLPDHVKRPGSHFALISGPPDDGDDDELTVCEIISSDYWHL